MRTDKDYALALDAQDELAGWRDEFIIDDPDLIYLDGNSLGRLPKKSAARAREVLEQEWGGRLIRGWGEGWFNASQRVGGKIAQLIGAQPDEVIIGDSTSVNFFKLVIAALNARPDRRRVVTDDLNFPSDLYLLQGVLDLLGRQHEPVRLHSADGMTVSDAALAQVITGETALVTLTHTAFKSGWTYDLAGVTAMTHRAGALMLWDLSHSAGAMPLELNRAEVDLAVGCTYKYLNGGPGAPAFMYVRRDLQEQLCSPIWGWFSQKNQFEMALDYTPAPGMARFLAGTPPMLSLAPIETGVELLLTAGMERLRAKSVQQTEYLIGLWQELLEPLGVTLNSPRDWRRRGSHVSLGHPEGLRIDHALIKEMRVIPDFRYPDNIRLGIAPLYTSFADIHEGMMRLRRVIADRLYEKYPQARGDVT
ncbi:MAG: kynureninase [Anaerolineae bacterium]